MDNNKHPEQGIMEVGSAEDRKNAQQGMMERDPAEDRKITVVPKGRNFPRIPQGERTTGLSHYLITASQPNIMKQSTWKRILEHIRFTLDCRIMIHSRIKQ
jgi:hypothetical protein